jgi:hypothetical protein
MASEFIFPSGFAEATRQQITTRKSKMENGKLSLKPIPAPTTIQYALLELSYSMIPPVYLKANYMLKHSP